MIFLRAMGCSHRNAPVAVRERLAFDDAKISRTLGELSARHGCEGVILSTCNRVEVYLTRIEATLQLDAEFFAEFLSEVHQLPAEEIRPYLYVQCDADAVAHLFRVTASLDSMIVGEGQIAGQVKRAYELAQQCPAGGPGPLLHALFQHAQRTAKRVRAETGLAQGKVSVSSAAVEYVSQVFEHFHDKTVLVIGAGKMGELTLKHLKELKPRRIWVTNRSPEKADAVAQGCGGQSVAWSQLDDGLARADIILSTTGATEPIVTLERYQKAKARRSGGPVVILDIAVPRDFDPRIADDDGTFLFNIDDLHKIRARTLQARLKHVGPAEAIVEQEQRRFLHEWMRRRNGPIIAKLMQDMEAKRLAIVAQLLARLNSKLSEADRAYIEGAFRLLQNQFLHGPISALAVEPHEAGGHTLREALRKLFSLEE